MNDFENSVFLNCPFDTDYREFLEALLFTLVDCGLIPRIASERLDSSESRITKILELIENSRFSIHDLSRIKASEPGEFSRLNMPFEIGLDFGCKRYHSDEKCRRKCSLILEPERFSVQRALSDLSGFDIKCHHNSAEILVPEVRNWLAEAGLRNLPGPLDIWKRYLEFSASLNLTLAQKGFSLEQVRTLPVPEFLDYLAHYRKK